MITAETLEAKGACHNQVALFREHFPEGAPMTVAAAVSVACLFGWDWAARNLLSAPASKAYREAVAPARRAYREATAPALKAYNEAVATALKAYNGARATAWSAYNEAEATAWRAYNEAVAPALKAYNKAVAPAFAQAYIADQVQK